jgi:hypothetical protein
MVAAPLALLSAMVVHPAHAADGGSWLAAAEAGPARFYAAHLLILVAVALFVPVTLALADLVRPRRPAAATLGSALTLLGLLAVAVLVGMDFVAWQVARSTIEADQALALLHGALTSPGVVAPLTVLLPGLVLGPALLAIALHRERIVPAWRAALIPLGLAGAFGGLPIAPVAIVGAATLVMSLGGLGLRSLGGGRDPVGVPVEKHLLPRRATGAAPMVADPPQWSWPRRATR